MHLYLITHAATQMSKTTAVASWALSPAGEEQARKLAACTFWNDVGCIVLSSEPKTQLTVEPLLAMRPIPTIVDARLDELYRPGWVDDYAVRVRQAFAAPTVPAGEWESAAAALTRVQEAIAALVASYRDQTLALVGHGLTLSLYRADLLGQSHVNYNDWSQLSFAAVALVDPLAKVLIHDFEAVAGAMPRGR